MRNDLVEKYQHYMTEAARLQKLVDEQAAYIAELEESILALSEDYVTPERAEELDQASKTADEKYKARATELLKPKKKKGKKGETAVNLSPEEQQELHDLRTAAELASIHNYLEKTHKTKLYGKGGNLIGKVSPPEN